MAARKGSMELAVLRDLRELGLDATAGKRCTLAELAVGLARVFDTTPDGQVMAKAKVAMELRVLLGQLRELAGERGDGKPEGGMSTPVWDRAQSGPADAGSEGGGGGAAVGDGPDAAPAGDL